MEEAIRNYLTLVGKGGFGKVYRGTYHLEVAIKVLNEVGMLFSCCMTS